MVLYTYTCTAIYDFSCLNLVPPYDNRFVYILHAEIIMAECISDSAKLEAAERFKKEGNEFYKNKNYKGAIGKYHRAIIQLKAVGQSRNVGSIMGLSSDHTDTPREILDQSVRLKADCYSNLAGEMNGLF